MKKILICDDFSALRKGVKMILQSEFPGVEFSEAIDTADSISQALSGKWSLIILDVNMPGRGGLEVLAQIKQAGIKVPVLVFSMHPEEQIGIKVLKLGAAGYLSKATADIELTEAARTVLAGKKFITPALAEKLADIIENPEGLAPHEMLSPREFETMIRLAKGESLTQIADSLSLSAQTVSTYRTRIMEKMALRTNSDCTLYCIHNHLI